MGLCSGCPPLGFEEELSFSLAIRASSKERTSAGSTSKAPSGKSESSPSANRAADVGKWRLHQPRGHGHQKQVTERDDDRPSGTHPSSGAPRVQKRGFSKRNFEKPYAEVGIKVS